MHRLKKHHLRPQKEVDDVGAFAAHSDEAAHPTGLAPLNEPAHSDKPLYPSVASLSVVHEMGNERRVSELYGEGDIGVREERVQSPVMSSTLSGPFNFGAEAIATLPLPEKNAIRRSV
jgi:hypothetical protein